MTTTIQNTNDLLSFLVAQADVRKDWFGFTQQKMTSITLAHEIAARHADKMTPDEVVNYAVQVNEIIYQKIAKPTSR